MQKDNMKMQETINDLHGEVRKLEREKESLEIAVRNQNKLIEYIDLEHIEFIENMESGIYAILHKLHHINDTSEKGIRNLLDNIGTIAVNASVGNDLLVHYEREIIEGVKLAEQIAKDFLSEVERLENENKESEGINVFASKISSGSIH